MFEWSRRFRCLLLQESLSTASITKHGVFIALLFCDENKISAETQSILHEEFPLKLLPIGIMF